MPEINSFLFLISREQKGHSYNWDWTEKAIWTACHRTRAVEAAVKSYRNIHTVLVQISRKFLKMVRNDD